jgi:threonine/homoserine/homoserine lactone efflux protein
MPSDQAIAFFAFAFVAAITPGPSNFMVTATGSAAGFLRGLPCVLGVSTGMASLLFSAALGLGHIVLAHPMILKIMNLGGAAFLFWLAWKIASAGPASDSGEVKPVGFLGAALFQWANPKAWLIAVSAVGTFLHADSNSQLLQAAVFGGLFFAAALPSNLVWLALGAVLQVALRDERKARVFNVIMGLALASSVMMIFR